MQCPGIKGLCVLFLKPAGRTLEEVAIVAIK